MVALHCGWYAVRYRSMRGNQADCAPPQFLISRRGRRGVSLDPPPPFSNVAHYQNEIIKRLCSSSRVAAPVVALERIRVRWRGAFTGLWWRGRQWGTSIDLATYATYILIFIITIIINHRLRGSRRRVAERKETNFLSNSKIVISNVAFLKRTKNWGTKFNRVGKERRFWVILYERMERFDTK